MYFHHIFSILLMLCQIFPLTLLGQTNLKIEGKYKHEVSVGCGKNLNPQALELQDKGMEIFWIKERTEEAVGLLEKAIEIEPRLGIAYSQLALYYSYLKNDFKSAKSILLKALKHCPNNPNSYNSLGDVYSKFQKENEAILSYSKAIELGMDSIPACYFNIGNSYLKLEKFDRAIEYYLQAISLDTNYFKAYKNLVVSYYRIGDKKNALRYISRIEKIDKKGEFAQWIKNVRENLGNEQ